MRDRTEICESFLEHLGDDPSARAQLVETLRAAAERIEATAALEPFGAAHGAQVSAIDAGVHHKMARRLREVAASLCDHARTHGPRCRYCESVLPFARYDTDILVRGIE